MALSLRDKIFRRAGHLVFEYDHRMCIWGGFTERVPLVSKNIIVKCYDNHYSYMFWLSLDMKVFVQIHFSRNLSFQTVYQKMKMMFFLQLKFFHMTHAVKIGIGY